MNNDAIKIKTYLVHFRMQDAIHACTPKDYNKKFVNQIIQIVLVIALKISCIVPQKIVVKPLLLQTDFESFWPISKVSDRFTTDSRKYKINLHLCP